MIFKNRLIPIRIRQNEALIRRISAAHPQRSTIEGDLAKRKAGYRGEQSLDYYLSQLPAKEFTILHDLRLYNGSTYFQIDTLILSPYFALIIEVKNILGTLLFDETFNQLIRTRNEKEEGFPNPLIQVKRQKTQFKTWLIQNLAADIPIEYLIGISSPSTILKTSANSSNVPFRVIHIENLIYKIKFFKQSYPIEVITSRQIKKISRALVINHVPGFLNVLDHYNISSQEIIAGVQCPSCLIFPMRRIHGDWLCPKCGCKDKKAHLPAIQDYLLLISPTISNKQARAFLHLASEDTASRLLSAMPSSGTKKGRIYFLQ
ncbi:nuclease-related domain-containing protein [Cytobacillus sp. NJ13]|nr:nuclease-related domain-containing protein [Cytobacillus sp. NJ13]